MWLLDPHCAHVSAGCSDILTTNVYLAKGLTCLLQEVSEREGAEGEIESGPTGSGQQKKVQRGT